MLSNPFESQIDPVEQAENNLANLQAEYNQLTALQRELQIKISKARQLVTHEKEERKRREIERAREQEKKRLAEEKKQKQLARQETVELVAKHSPQSWELSRDYQKEDIIQGFHQFRTGANGFFNANDMGLGKTFEAIASMELIRSVDPDSNFLWLTKSSILITGGTKREIERWSGFKVVELDGSEPKKVREFKIELAEQMKGIVLLTNYETVRTTETLQNSDSFPYLIVDEVHKLKGGANPSGPTGIWTAVKEFAHNKVKFSIFLSGTPMVNRVAELWAYLHIFSPDKFPNLNDFERAFNVYQEWGGNIQTDKILDMCLKDNMVRRTRNEVGLELPELTIDYKLVTMTPAQQEAYDQMRDNFFIWLDEQEEKALTAKAIIAQLIRLRQIVVWPNFTQTVINPETGEKEIRKIEINESGKVDEAMEIIEEAKDQVLVFCNFNDVFSEIKKRCTEIGIRCEFITGNTKSGMSSFEVEFQKGNIDVLCINSSMGEGLNLQKNPEQWPGGASIGIHLDRWWNVSRDDQCFARMHRSGAHQPVFGYYIHIPNSVDDYVKALSDEKAMSMEGIMNDDRVRPASYWKTMLKEIL